MGCEHMLIKPCLILPLLLNDKAMIVLIDLAANHSEGSLLLVEKALRLSKLYRRLAGHDWIWQ
ncbi:MAG: hypothetical protein RL571_1574 [Pseudomonadota bacterium]|jgi:hypothetical protein